MSRGGGGRMQVEVRQMDANRFGCFVAERRKELHMTQKDLAAKIHVTDKAVSKWERGLGLPDINSIEDLADALDVSITELMRSEMNVNEETEQVVSDVIEVARKDIDERQRIIINTFAATSLLLALIQMLLSIRWNADKLQMRMDVPITAYIPGLLLIIYGIVCKIKGKKAEGVIPIGLSLLIIPIVIFGAAYMICALVTG